MIVDSKVNMLDQAAKLVKQTQPNSLHSIICVTGGFDIGSVRDSNIFEEYER